MWLGIILSTAMWGVAPIFEKIYTKHISMITIAFMFSLFIAILSPVFWIICRKTIKNEVPLLFGKNKVVLWYCILGIACGLIATLSYIWAIKLSNDHNKTYLVVALTCIYPLITALLLWFLYNEHLSFFAWVGIALIVIGVMLLSLHK